MSESAAPSATPTDASATAPSAHPSAPPRNPKYAPRPPYGYKPSLDSTVVFTTAFAILTLIHLFIAFRHRYWGGLIAITMVAGGTLEVIGWSARLWSHFNVLLWTPFIMQTTCLILGPVFFSAWDYAMLAACITRFGSKYSLLGPKWYLIVFIIADAVSLILQAVGGGGAAKNAKMRQKTTTNTHIMLSGILFQLAATTIFVGLAIDFMVRVMWDRPYAFKVRKEAQAGGEGHSLGYTTHSRNYSASSYSHGASSHGHGYNHYAEYETKEGSTVSLKAKNDPWLGRSQLLLLGIGFATLMIYIRGIYRTIELAQGWEGYLITHEVYFIWLDGFIMALCMMGLAVAHPGWLLPKATGSLLRGGPGIIGSSSTTRLTTP